MRLNRLFLTIASIALPAIAIFAMQAIRQYGPWPNDGSLDSGTCGNFWATDSYDRYFKVSTRPNRDGTYSVVEQFKNGTFVGRTGEPSPGACEGGGNNGGTIGAGLTGNFQGQFWIKVSNGTYNPNADTTNFTTTQAFINAVFGPNATYVVYSFSLNYNAGNRGDWKNASKDKGGNHGDIR